MPRNFDVATLRTRFRDETATWGAWNKDPRVTVRLALGVLLLANIAAALILLKPWGGSAEDLARQLQDLQRQLAMRQLTLTQTKTLAGKVEKARAEGDQFLSKYTLDGRTAYSTIIGELDQMAVQSAIKPKESAFVKEPIEGSDTLSMMTVTAGFEGSYANLTKFVNLLDKSPKFLIIESMAATPQQNGAVLNVNIRLNSFVRDEPGGAQ
jgi:hypothetical protein